MSDTTTIACWPACVDAIEWSYDGIIALASEEQVELLFPHTKSNDTEHDFSSWHHIPLAVSWFTATELPEKEAGPISTYSVGEEVSTSAPISIAWSPPGIAKHRRCALGVLTSSLVLSIWASEGKIDDEVSWKRKLIINDALVLYFSSNLNEVESTLVHETVEKMRLRTRIRCFAWAPSLPSPEPAAIIGTQTTWAQPIVAVANDDNQIAFVAIDTPATTLGAEEEWSGEALNHFSVTPDSENVFESADTFDEIMQQQRHVSRLAWSPWTVRGDWYHSVLVYATNEDVRARVITYSGETIGIGNDEVIYPDIKLRYAGPMKWSSKIEDGDTVTLSLFSLTNVVILKISAGDAAIIARVEHDLDGRWDEMSAAVWDHTAEDPTIHFASLQATLSYTSRLQCSNNSLTPISNHPHWREQLWDTQALFSAQHELAGNVRSKVWGLSTSPLGDFVAACSTVHPSDMIEYGPPNDRRTSIAISGLRNYDKDAKLETPAQNCSAEGLVFSLRKWAERTGDGNESAPSTIDEVTTQLFALHSKPSSSNSNGESTASVSTTDIRALITHIKHTLLFFPPTLKNRLHNLVSQTLAPSLPTVLPRTLIAYRLATFTSSFPPALTCATPFSAEITEHHRRVVALVDTIMVEGDEERGQGVVSAHPCDTCNFCAAEIPLEDLDTAWCTNGHEFSRCGISFVAIQRPRISKACALCRTPYLSEEFVGAQEQDEDGGRMEGEVSLARALFLACDVCVYCGGKFTG
ncbi:hypothetical protein P171DRAFT_520254 [Karstenula rhodostoma CBS 690.94]|uniref:Transcription factor IIIC subunit delta N-term-domain-containing protein n=1 Tax=Karstenula rhodostoma CBS 690.94 TaxID=1392251 RepID=A0A9P4UBD7_9PLEO|nr:hypothetical protein P171DRAFT_520254 [Karstenula rhodostoma CBS 690.94]